MCLHTGVHLFSVMTIVSTAWSQPVHQMNHHFQPLEAAVMSALLIIMDTKLELDAHTAQLLIIILVYYF